MTYRLDIGATASLRPGPARDALCDAIRALDEVEENPNPGHWCNSLLRVGRCYRSVGAPEMAQWYLQQGLGWARTIGATTLIVDLLCELAEIALQLAEAETADLEGRRRADVQRDHARDHCFEASTLASRAADTPWEVAVLLRAGEVLDRCGDHADAAELQCRALALICEQACAAATADDTPHAAAA